MSNRLFSALAVIAVLGLASCGGPPSTVHFIRKADMSGMYEIAAGKIASEKGKSEAVRQFGRQMVEAHGKMAEALKSVVKGEKLDDKLRSKLDRKYQRMIDRLNAAPPQDFDAAYAAQQVNVHRKTAELFDAYAEEGENEAFKQFAANVLPTINQHLDDAKKLAR